MSLIPVKTKLLCNSSSKPTGAMLDKVAAAGAMAGLSGLGLDCQWDDNTERFVGDCDTYGIDSSGSPIISGVTRTGGGGAGWATISDLMKMGLSIAGMAYLNNNQAKIATYGPNGTVLYQTSQIPSQFMTGPAVSGRVGAGIGTGGAGGGGMFQMSTTAVIAIGAAAMVAVMMMSRRH